MSDDTDWAAWSREAVALLQARNQSWIQRFSLKGAPYRWDMDRATITFARPDDSVVAEICFVGTASACEGTFLWAWANETTAPESYKRLARVREFGEANDLELLTTPEWPGGRAEGLEMLAVSGRILDAEGTWVDTAGDLTLFFLLFGLQTAPSAPSVRTNP